MDYENILEPLSLIFVSFCAGAFFGSLWMFYIMYKEEKELGIVILELVADYVKDKNLKQLK